MGFAQAIDFIKEVGERVRANTVRSRVNWIWSMPGSTSKWVEEMFHKWLRANHGLGWQLFQRHKAVLMKDDWWKVTCWHDTSQGLSKVFRVKKDGDSLIVQEEV